MVAIAGSFISFSTASGAFATSAASGASLGAVYSSLVSLLSSAPPGTQFAQAVLLSGGAGAVLGPLASDVVGRGSDTLLAAALSAVSGAGAAAGFCSGTTALKGILAGPLALLPVGADALSFDCWRPVLHDSRPADTKGKPLRELLAHPTVKSVDLIDDDLFVENMWAERFVIRVVTFADRHLVALHAFPVI